MRVAKEKRPQAGKHERRCHKDEDIVTDIRPFVAYYIGLALLVAYGCACFARDMGWFA